MMKNSLRDKLRQMKKEKKGAYSIIIITLTLIVITAFAGYSDILSQSIILHEMQQKMDRSSLNALNGAIDITQLRNEVLAMDDESYVGKDKQQALRRFEQQIEKEFSKELFNMVGTNDIITDITVRHVDASIDVSDWGTGSDGLQTPQIYLETIVQVKMKVHSQFDIFNSEEMMNSFTNSRNEVTVISKSGKSNDGITELLIHNSTRLMYR